MTETNTSYRVSISNGHETYANVKVNNVTNGWLDFPKPIYASFHYYNNSATIVPSSDECSKHEMFDAGFFIVTSIDKIETIEHRTTIFTTEF